MDKNFGEILINLLRKLNSDEKSLTFIEESFPISNEALERLDDDDPNELKKELKLDFNHESNNHNCMQEDYRELKCDLWECTVCSIFEQRMAKYVLKSVKGLICDDCEIDYGTFDSKSPFKYGAFICEDCYNKLKCQTELTDDDLNRLYQATNNMRNSVKGWSV